MITLDFITDSKDYLDNFNGRRYEEAFNHFKGRLSEALNGVSFEDADRNVDELVEGCAEKLDETKKWKRKGLATDFRVLLALYMIPALVSIDTDISRYYSEQIIEKWNARFPEPPIKASNFDEINDGFKKELGDIFGLRSTKAKK